jgi:hypothetical protein
MEYADSIEELSQKIGVSTDKLQEWDFAAKQNGATVDSLADFIMKLSLAAQDFDNAGAFANLGIDPSKMSNEQLFSAVAANTQGKSFNEIAKIISELGLNAKAFKNVVNLLQSDLESAGETARSFGAVIDQQTIHALATLNDQLSIVGQVLMGHFAPALLEAGKFALKAFSGIKAGGAILGAKTAGMSYGDIAAYLFLTKKSREDVMARANKSVPQDIAEEVAVSEAAKIFDSLQKMLESIDKYSAPEAAKIGDPIARADRSKAAKLVSDSLVSVGNFLGTSRTSIADLARKQVDLLVKIERNTRTPPSSGEDDSGFPP